MITHPLFVAALSVAAALPAQEHAARSMPIPWSTDFAAAQKRASKADKPMLLMFSTTWCKPCKQIIRDVLPDEKVQQELAALECVYIDADEHGDLVERYAVRGFPSFVFTDAAGAETRRSVGSSGTVDGFLGMLNEKAKPRTANAESAGTEQDFQGKPEPRAIAALEALAASAWRFAGSVKVEVPDDGGEGGMMMMVGGPEVTPAFEGELDVLRTADGACLACSKKPVPGIAILQTGRKTIVRSTAPLGARRNAAALNSDIAVLLRPATLLEWAKANAVWKVKTGAEDRTTFATVVPGDFDTEDAPAADFDDPMAGMADPMKPRILKTRLQLSVDAAGKLIAIDVRTTWSDPHATMMELAQQGGELDFEELMEAEPVAGPMHRYCLTAVNGAPSKRVAGMLKDLRSSAR